MYSGAWRNWIHTVYGLTCRLDELEMFDPKLVTLLKRYGEAFDDEWWYFLNRPRTYVRKVPIWLRQKRVDQEKAVLATDPHQTRL